MMDPRTPRPAGPRCPDGADPGAARPRLVLASQSPRRAELLRRMGFVFDVVAPDVPEDVPEGADPRELVVFLSAKKAEAALPAAGGAWVVGADTVVVLDGAILGKPSTPEDAVRMLRLLSDRTHDVFTGFTLIHAETGRRLSDVECTSVTFRPLEDWEISGYVSTGSPLDKAGAYGIQDRSGLFVDRIDGCFYNVVGFPLTRFYEGLKRAAGLETLRRLMTAGPGIGAGTGSGGSGFIPGRPDSMETKGGRP
jgi:septum formation protein